jgi:hypothetical protein
MMMTMMFQQLDDAQAAFSSEIKEQQKSVSTLHYDDEDECCGMSKNNNDPRCCGQQQSRCSEVLVQKASDNDAMNDSSLSLEVAPNNDDDYDDGSMLTMTTTKDSIVLFPKPKQDPFHGYDSQRRSPTIISLLGSQFDKSVSFR